MHREWFKEVVRSTGELFCLIAFVCVFSSRHWKLFSHIQRPSGPHGCKDFECQVRALVDISIKVKRNPQSKRKSMLFHCGIQKRAYLSCCGSREFSVREFSTNWRFHNISGSRLIWANNIQWKSFNLTKTEQSMQNNTAGIEMWFWWHCGEKANFDLSIFG